MKAIWLRQGKFAFEEPEVDSERPDFAAESLFKALGKIVEIFGWASYLTVFAQEFN